VAQRAKNVWFRRSTVTSSKCLAFPHAIQPSARPHAPDEFPACPSRISGLFHQVTYETPQFRSRSRKICADQVPRSFGPAIFQAKTCGLDAVRAPDWLTLHQLNTPVRASAVRSIRPQTPGCLSAESCLPLTASFEPGDLRISCVSDFSSAATLFPIH